MLQLFVKRDGNRPRSVRLRNGERQKCDWHELTPGSVFEIRKVSDSENFQFFQSIIRRSTQTLQSGHGQF